ncbi:MAG: transcription antitermination factor NusB [Bacteroidales bacterium]
MINRALIRIKVVQLLYSYYQNEERDMARAEKELLFSLDKAYELYNYLLLLIVEITDAQNKRIETAKSKFLASDEDLNPNTKFVDNLFVYHLRQDPAFREYLSMHKLAWDEEFVKDLLDLILTSECYQEYMNSSTRSFEEDKDLWRTLFKTFIVDNERLAELLEESSLYWNDDIEIVQSFAFKTIKQFAQSEEPQLLPQYRSDEEKEYAIQLFRNAIVNGQEYKDMITKYTSNWDINRIALMDVIVMQIALAEIMTFPAIPTSVSLNEYIDLAKTYSTLKSGYFINGVLDRVVRNLKEEGILLKK